MSHMFKVRTSQGHKMKNDYISKWKLFITSYLPLYIWLLFSNIKYQKLPKIFRKCLKIICEKGIEYLINNYRFWFVFLIVLISLITISICQIIQLFIGSRSEIQPLPRKMEISPESDSLMNYVVTYFTPLLSFNIHDLKSIVMNVLLFLLIGLMYVGSSATYLNPVLGIFGFRVFGVSGYPNAHHIISRLSFDDIETAKKRGDEIERYRIGDGIYIIKPKSLTKNKVRK